MLQRILLKTTEYKWLILVYAVFAVTLCLLVYINTKEFNWNKKTIAWFSVFYDLDNRSRVAFAISLGRIALVLYYAASLGCKDIFDLILIEAITVITVIISGNYKSMLQVLSYLGIFGVLFLERMFFEYYFDMGKELLILFVAVSFGLFGFMYSVLQFFVFWEQLLVRTFKRDLAKYKKLKLKAQ